jgi:hypothetical protein
MTAHHAAVSAWRTFLVFAIVGGLLVLAGIRTLANADGNGLILLAAGGMCGAFSVMFFKSWKAKKATALLIKPQPACEPNPVKYHGWQGSIHTFDFANQSYAVTFATANHRKVLN